jgi:hypothetical protein
MVQYNVQWLEPYNVCRKGQHSPQQHSCSHQALQAATTAQEAASPAPPPTQTAAAARVSMLMQYRLPWTQHMCTCRADGASIWVAQPWCRLRGEREAVRWCSTTCKWLVPYNVCRQGQHSPQQQSCSHQALQAATTAQEAASPAPPPTQTAAAARVSMLMQYRLPWTQHMCTFRADGASIGVAQPWCRLRGEREAVRWCSTTCNGWCRTMCAGRGSTHPSSRAVATRLSRRQQRPKRLPPQPPLLHEQRQLHVSAC